MWYHVTKAAPGKANWRQISGTPAQHGSTKSVPHVYKIRLHLSFNPTSKLEGTYSYWASKSNEFYRLKKFYRKLFLTSSVSHQKKDQRKVHLKIFHLLDADFYRRMKNSSYKYGGELYGPFWCYHNAGLLREWQRINLWFLGRENTTFLHCLNTNLWIIYIMHIMNYQLVMMVM